MYPSLSKILHFHRTCPSLLRFNSNIPALPECTRIRPKYSHFTPFYPCLPKIFHQKYSYVRSSLDLPILLPFSFNRVFRFLVSLPSFTLRLTFSSTRMLLMVRPYAYPYVYPRFMARDVVARLYV
jgi:hypothetical protein